MKPTTVHNCARRPQALRAIKLTAMVALLALAIPVLADPGTGRQTRIYPPHEKAFNTTYSELAGAWWNWALNQPPDMLPITDETGEFCHVGQDEDFGQGEKIFFLAGNFGGPEQTVRHCVIPRGKALFFPILNNLFVTPEEGTIAEVRALANEATDPSTVLECVIDGVPVDDLFAYRAQSPPGGSPFEVRPGTFAATLLPPRGPEPAVADGYWLLVELGDAPEHVIEFRGKIGDPDNPDFQLSVKYVLTDRQPPRIIRPQGNYLKNLFGKLGAEWWKALFSIPVVDGDHPFFSGGAFGSYKGLTFLTGAVDATVDLTVEKGTFLFFPVVNAECSVMEPDPFHGDDEASLRACANGHIDHTSGWFATIDGYPVTNLDELRVESPLFEFGPLPEGNLFGVPAGTTSPAVDAGVYILLAPLPEGAHTIRFGSTFDDLNFSIDTTYNINVVPDAQND